MADPTQPLTTADRIELARQKAAHVLALPSTAAVQEGYLDEPRPETMALARAVYDLAEIAAEQERRLEFTEAVIGRLMENLSGKDVSEVLKALGIDTGPAVERVLAAVRNARK